MATIPLRSFERKVKYLRGWHSSDTRWQILFPDFDETIDRIERMSSDRHRLIHGAIKNLPEYEDDGFIVLRRTLEMNGDKTTFEEANYNLAAIRGFRRDIVLTATFLGQFASILAGHAD
ncbi:hypothetical protein GJW-30_1_00873 [Variibacter gotjawalensis]|uniref:Uncharacterized protein n=2 Tax=Variibacter gotjawalensis TaxID=1333996 RepID=A0A0S3PR45_9BRAD|nr:hypothetical protein EV661_2980 [Variibacter gotjawalensis]BAT58349.1 hypothetical protein GJW-30_1_00873 [Variibacter gotjawalensis]